MKKAKKGNLDGFDELWAFVKEKLYFLQKQKKLNIAGRCTKPLDIVSNNIAALSHYDDGTALECLKQFSFDKLRGYFTALDPATSAFRTYDVTKDSAAVLSGSRIQKKHKSIIKSITRLEEFVKSLPDVSAPQSDAATGSAPDLTLPLIKKYWTDFWRQFFRCCRYRVILNVLRNYPSSSVAFLYFPENFNSDNDVGKTGKHLNLRPFGPSEHVSKEMNSAYTSVAKQVFYVQGETKKPLDKSVATDTKANLSDVGPFDKFLSEFVTAFIKKLGHEEKPDLKKYYKRNFVNVIVKQTTNLKTLAGQYKAQAVKNANSYIAKATARGNKVRSLMKDFYKVLLKSPRDDTAEKKFTYEPPTGSTFKKCLNGLNPDFNKSDDNNLVIVYCSRWGYYGLDVGDSDLNKAYRNYKPVLFSPEKFNQLCSEIKTETKKLKAIIADHKKLVKKGKTSLTSGLKRLISGGL